MVVGLLFSFFVAVIIRFTTPLSLPDVFTKYPNAESVCHFIPFIVALMETFVSRLLLGCTLLPLAGPFAFLQAFPIKKSKTTAAKTSLFIYKICTIKITRKYSISYPVQQH